MGRAIACSARVIGARQRLPSRSMWITLLLVVGSVLLVVSGFTWAARREALDRARDIERLSPIGIDTLSEPRMVAIRGRAGSDAALTDPVTEARVVFYEVRLARMDGGERVLRALRGGDSLRLEEDGARAEVRLEGAEIGVDWEELDASEREPSPRMKALLEAGGVAVPEPDRAARYVIFHRAIRVGDELTVVGTPSFGGEAPPVFEANGAMLIVTAGGLDALKQRERADMRAMSMMLRIAVAIGVIALGVAGALIAIAS